MPALPLQLLMAVAIMMLMLTLLLVLLLVLVLVVMLVVMLVVTITDIVVTPVAIEGRDESLAGEPPDKPAQPCEKSLRMLLLTFH